MLKYVPFWQSGWSSLVIPRSIKWDIYSYILYLLIYKADVKYLISVWINRKVIMPSKWIGWNSLWAHLSPWRVLEAEWQDLGLQRYCPVPPEEWPPRRPALWQPRCLRQSIIGKDELVPRKLEPSGDAGFSNQVLSDFILGEIPQVLFPGVDRETFPGLPTAGWHLRGWPNQCLRSQCSCSLLYICHKHRAEYFTKCLQVWHLHASGFTPWIYGIRLHL